MSGLPFEATLWRDRTLDEQPAAPEQAATPAMADRAQIRAFFAKPTA